MYETDIREIEKKTKNNKEALGWMRTFSSNSKKRSSKETRKFIEEKLINVDIDKLLNITPRCKMILERCEDFNFKIFTVRKETQKNEMVVITTYLLRKHNMFINLKIDPEVFMRYMRKIQDGYFDVAYHNQIHGTDVARLAYHYAQG